MFDHPAFDAHEGVHMFHDAETGLRGIIAIHSTALGPAAGGCRMWNYATGEEALDSTHVDCSGSWRYFDHDTGDYISGVCT